METLNNVYGKANLIALPTQDVNSDLLFCKKTICNDVEIYFKGKFYIGFGRYANTDVFDKYSFYIVDNEQLIDEWFFYDKETNTIKSIEDGFNYSTNSMRIIGTTDLFHEFGKFIPYLDLNIQEYFCEKHNNNEISLFSNQEIIVEYLKSIEKEIKVPYVFNNNKMNIIT